MTTLIMMQGPPGSGKSSVAVKLAAVYDAVICSTDEYSMEDGVYVYRPEKVPGYHELNQQRTIQFLETGRSVVVDNTNIKRVHALPYVKAAVAHNIPVIFVRCCGKYPNTHGVPAATVERMGLEMEDLSVDSVMACDPAQDRPVFLRVPASCVPAIVEKLRSLRREDAATRVEEFASRYLDPVLNAERLRWLARAHETVQKDGEIEFDDDATVSGSREAGESGEYVLGWVWVDGPEPEEPA